jgi:hypothetical protein
MEKHCSKDKDEYFGINPDDIPEPEEALINLMKRVKKINLTRLFSN